MEPEYGNRTLPPPRVSGIAPLARINSALWMEPGIFSFTYYLNNTYTNTMEIDDIYDFISGSKYAKGISIYSNICKNSDYFKNWNVVVYTNEYTYKYLSSYSERAKTIILVNSNSEPTTIIPEFKDVIFKVIREDEYDFKLTQYNTKINKYNDVRLIKMMNRSQFSNDKNSLLRCFRFRALVDFPNRPVFIRDADTIFASLLKLENITQYIHDWELKYYNYFIESGKYVNLSFQPGYNRDWHTNIKYNYNSPLGLYAGLVSILPFENSSEIWPTIWAELLQYILHRCEIYNTLTSDKVRHSYRHMLITGTDEQLLLFIFLKNSIIFKNTYFFLLDYAQEGTIITQKPSNAYNNTKIHTLSNFTKKLIKNNVNKSLQTTLSHSDMGNVLPTELLNSEYIDKVYSSDYHTKFLPQFEKIINEYDILCSSQSVRKLGGKKTRNKKIKKYRTNCRINSRKRSNFAN